MQQFESIQKWAPRRHRESGLVALRRWFAAAPPADTLDAVAVEGYEPE